MHGGSLILDFDAAENDHAGNDQRFGLGIGGDARLPRGVLISAEHGNIFGMDVPGFRHADLNAAEDAVDFQNGFLFHIGIPKVQFNATKDGGGLAALKILAADSPLASAKYRDRVKSTR